MLWLLNEVNEPNVKAGFDAWAPTLQGLSSSEIGDAVHKMAPYLAFTIAADYRKLPRFKYEPTLTNYVPQQTDLVRAVPMGTGIVDYQTFFGALLDIGYRGCVAYELCEVLDGGGSEENLDRAAKTFLDYLNNFRPTLQVLNSLFADDPLGARMDLAAPGMASMSPPWQRIQRDRRLPRRRTMHNCTWACGNKVPMALGNPLSPSTHAMKISDIPRFFISVGTLGYSRLVFVVQEYESIFHIWSSVRHGYPDGRARGADATPGLATWT